MRCEQRRRPMRLTIRLTSPRCGIGWSKRTSGAERSCRLYGLRRRFFAFNHPLGDRCSLWSSEHPTFTYTATRPLQSGTHRQSIVEGELAGGRCRRLVGQRVDDAIDATPAAGREVCWSSKGSSPREVRVVVGAARRPPRMLAWFVT